VEILYRLSGIHRETGLGAMDIIDDKIISYCHRYQYLEKSVGIVVGQYVVFLCDSRSKVFAEYP
jgi:hypothetical protein